MPKRKPVARKRALRRTPDARALEWAEKRLERAEKLHQWHTEKLQGLHSEIPRLRGIIAALGPMPTATGLNTGTLSGDTNNYAVRVAKPQRIVAGMDVSRFVNPRPTVAVPEPTMTDSEDALIDAVDGNLPKGTDLSQ